MEIKTVSSTRFQSSTWTSLMLQHCYHNIDTSIILDNAPGCEWYPVDATFTTEGCVERDELPNEIGRWKVGDWYYELNSKMNWMRWSHDGERFSYTWSKRKNRGDDFNEAEQKIENEVQKFMEELDIDDWGWRFLKIMPDDHMIWHIDSPNHAPCSINIALKDPAPIVFDHGRYTYKCALLGVSDKWHTVESGKSERLTFKIIPKAPYHVVRDKLESKQRLGDLLL